MKKLSAIKENVFDDMLKRNQGKDTRKENDPDNFDMEEFEEYLKTHYEGILGEKMIYNNHFDTLIVKFTFAYNDTLMAVTINYESDHKNIYAVTVSSEPESFDKIQNLMQDISPWWQPIEYNNSMLLNVEDCKEIKTSTCLKIIDTIIDNIPELELKRKMDENVFDDMLSRNRGKEERKENNVNMMEQTGFFEYLQKHYNCSHDDGISIGRGYIQIPLKKNEDEKTFWTPQIAICYKNEYDIYALYIQYVCSKDPKIAVELKKRKYPFKYIGKGRGVIYADYGIEINHEMCIEIIDLFIDNMKNTCISRKVNENVFDDMLKRSHGEEKRKEDKVTILYHPQDRFELQQCIYDIEKNNGYPEDLDLRCIDVSQVDSFAHIFSSKYEKTKMKSVNVTGWETENIEEMDSMFLNCSGLEYIYGLDTWEMKNITSMFDMFAGCNNLKELNIKDWNLKNVNFIGGIFKNCLNLKDPDLTNWEIHPECCTYIPSMFVSCKFSYERVGNKFNRK